MLRNALVTSYRTILNNRTYTVINLIGLVLGLTAAFVLLVFAINETSYNRSFDKKDRLYRIIITDSKGARTPSGSILLRPLLQQKVKGIVTSARIIHSMHFPGQASLVSAGKAEEIRDLISADEELFQILDMVFVIGSAPLTQNPGQRIFLSESAAKQYFGTSSLALGKPLIVRIGKKDYPLRLAGIFRDLPWNSTIRASFITDLSFYEKILGDLSPALLANHLSFEGFTAETILELGKDTRPEELSAKLDKGLDDKSWLSQKATLSLQPLTGIYLESNDLQNNAHLAGNKISVYTYSWLAFFILLLAGINYAILGTARSALRFKEIGIRKVLGATKPELRIQILIESVLLTLIALPLAMFFMGLIDPRITGVPDYTVTMHSVNLLKYILIFALVTIFIGILSGLYVAIYLAGLNPINALKAKFGTPGRFNLSKIFIGFQLFITLTLLICVITIYQQIKLSYISNLSASGKNIMLVSMQGLDWRKYFAVKHSLKNLEPGGLISGVSCTEIPSATFALRPMKGILSEVPVQTEWFDIDNKFFTTMGVPLIMGRDFDTTCNDRGEYECIINETAMKELGFSKPLGVVIDGFKVVGIAKDFSMHTVHQKIKSAAFRFNPYSVQTLLIRFQSGSEKQFASYVGEIWKKTVPDRPLRYSLYRSSLENAYQKENNFVTAVTIFTLLAFVITGMGLFGLSLLIAERKTKETAIRKVFGASNTQIILRMQKEFLIYTGIAAVIAIPVAWGLMEIWLSEFYYRVIVSIGTMTISVLAVTLFVSGILLYRTLKVLRINPINALKYE
jgi:putative ABC transport system permease protein